MKRFLRKLSVFCIPLLVFVACYIYVMSNMSGDLGNLGMIPFGEYEVGEEPDFVDYYECYSVEDAQNAEIVVIGDSFSNRKISSFENYIGNELGQKVCHLYLDMKKTNPCVAARMMIEKDLLPNCKIMVVESCERDAMWRLQSCFSGSVFAFKNHNNDSKDSFKIFDYLDLKKLSSFLKLSLNVDNPVGRLQLDDSYFTGRYSDRLYFYKSPKYNGGDLWYVGYDEKNSVKAKTNLLKIKQMASNKGIDFYFLMPPDKLDLYFNKIVDNPYPENTAIECFSDLDTTWFVNGKQLLMPLLENGVKDVYLKNDTHWSRLGAETAGRHIARLIKFKHGQER